MLTKADQAAVRKLVKNMASTQPGEISRGWIVLESGHELYVMAQISKRRKRVEQKGRVADNPVAKRLRAALGEGGKC